MGYPPGVVQDDDISLDRWRRRRRWRRRFNVAAALCVVALVGAGAWLGVYGHDQGLTRKWRGFVVDAFQERGIEIDLERLTLDPVQGLVARDVSIFEDASRKRVMAAIDHITLDIDYQSLMRGETQINHVDLRRADVLLPLTGEGGVDTGERLEVRNFDARVTLSGDRIELRQASGLLEGIKFDVRGTLLKSRQSGWRLPWLDDVESRDEDEDPDSREDLRARLHAIVSAWREIEWLGQAPTLHLVVTGDLEDWSTVVLDLDVRLGPFVYRGWQANSLEARVRVTASEASIKSLSVEDASGRLQAWAELKRSSQTIEFAAQSEIDVAGLLASLGLGDFSRQLVFYDAPRCSVQGTWSLEQGGEVDPDTGMPLALTLLGSADGGRIAARGVVFDRFSADVSASGGRWYVRNFRLQHVTGAITGEGFRGPEGFRHRLMMQMDPSHLMPFLQSDGSRSFLRQIEFEPDSFVLITSEGIGPGLHPDTWSSRIEVDVRELVLRGIRVRKLSTGIDAAPGRLQLNDLKVETPDGRLLADAVKDDEGLRFTARSDMSPSVIAPIMRLEETRSWLRRWSSGGESEYDLLIRGSGPELDPDTWTTQIDFEASSIVYRGESFDSLVGTVRLLPTGAEYLGIQIKRPEGVARLTKASRDKATELVTIDDFSGTIDPLVITRALAPGFARHLEPYRFSEIPRWSLKGVIGPEDGDSDCVLSIESGGVLEYELFGRTLPFDNVGGTVVFQGNEVVFDLQGGLFGGDASAGLVIERGQSPKIGGEVRLRGVRYGTLARVYSPDARPEGDLTGHFKFNSVLDNVRTLTGEGVAILVNGDLVSLPALGPLTPIVGAVLPNPIRDYSVAREASANFTVKDGVFHTEDFEALTSAFRMQGGGLIDPIDDRLEFEMTVNLRGAPGLVLLPVSKLLEFQGTGRYSDPVWRAKYLPIPGATGRGE